MRRLAEHKQPEQSNDSPFVVGIGYEPADDAEERLLRVYEFLLRMDDGISHEEEKTQGTS